MTEPVEKPKGCKARFYVVSVNRTLNQEVVKLAPIYSNDDKSPNYSYSKFTPAGSLELTITNENLFGLFNPIDVFDIDITLNTEATK